jgi:hypothetical protein
MHKGRDESLTALIPFLLEKRPEKSSERQDKKKTLSFIQKNELL